MRLSSENTAVVLDSTADLPDPRSRHGNWRLVPLYVRFGDETFRDHVDLSADEFYRRLRAASITPQTSQPTPADFSAVFDELSAYERIVCVLISGKLSGTAESARLAAQSLDAGRVTVIDSESASGGIVILADAIQRRPSAGRRTRRSTRSSPGSGVSRASSSPSTRSTTSCAAGASARRRAWRGSS